MPSNANRKLSVLLFADIQGYTSLMQVDESKAMDIIRKFEKVVESITPGFKGKIIQFYGDGCLISFDSCMQGVKCAIAMQQSFMEGNYVPVRIGIHLGDVVFENENVYGDGVNIASRIQEIGEPGAVLVSKPIRNEIKNKEGFKLLSLGKYDFKNVEEPLEIYALKNKGLVVPTTRIRTDILKNFKWLASIIGIVMLGFIGHNFYKHDHDTGPIAISPVEDVRTGDSYILTIGVDNNPNWLRLSNAKNDALGVRTVLKENFGFRDMTEPIINEQATKENILKALDDAENILDGDDELIVFFAGHGYSDNMDLNDEGEPTGFVIPYNANAENNNDLETYIKISDFLNKISSLPALHITTIFDACYSGFALGNELLVGRGSTGTFDKTSIRMSRKVFSSADYDQVAADNGPIAEHSLFTGILIEALRTAQADNNSDCAISMTELALYLERAIYEYSPIAQIPRFGQHRLDRGGEMYLYYDPEKIIEEKTRSQLIRNDDEIYIVLPFRSSTAGNEFNFLSSLIATHISDALTEYDRGKYKLERLDLYAEPDSIIANTPYSEYIKNSECTKYFSGSYEVFGDRISIRVRLSNAADNSELYVFPAINWRLPENYDFDDLLIEISSRIKGFMDNNQQVMDRITKPPNIEAYKALKEGYNHMCDDPDKARKHMDKAIETDPKYFRAYLGKAFSYVNCKPVNVFKALEEYEKFKDMEFDLTAYEEDRFRNFEYELRGDYEKLVGPKYELFKDFQTRNTFGDAAWYALASFNIAAANEMIALAEGNDINPDYRNYIFVIKNKIEQFCAPIQEPILYERFKREEKLIEDYPVYFFYSKMLFDCKSNCFAEIQNFFESHKYYTKSRKALWNRIAGDIASYLGDYSTARSFYAQGKLLFDEMEKPDIDEIAGLEYKLGNYDEVLSITESRVDSLLDIGEYSAVRYYIRASMKLDKPVENKQALISRIGSRTDFVGFGYYYIASILCAEGNFKEANNYIKLAKENGVGLTPERYNFDVDFKDMWDDPEFIRLTRLKI